MSRLRIGKIGVLSAAKMQALIALVLGLFISIPYGLIFMTYGIFGGRLVGGNAGLAVGGGGIVIGLVIMIGLPIIYSIFAFIFGAVAALIYNLFANMAGGIEIEVETIH